jgi:hypothetical protein
MATTEQQVKARDVLVWAVSEWQNAHDLTAAAIVEDPSLEAEYGSHRDSLAAMAAELTTELNGYVAALGDPAPAATEVDNDERIFVRELFEYLNGPLRPGESLDAATRDAARLDYARTRYATAVALVGL